MKITRYTKKLMSLVFAASLAAATFAPLNVLGLPGGEGQDGQKPPADQSAPPRQTADAAPPPPPAAGPPPAPAPPLQPQLPPDDRQLTVHHFRDGTARVNIDCPTGTPGLAHFVLYAGMWYDPAHTTTVYPEPLVLLLPNCNPASWGVPLPPNPRYPRLGLGTRGALSGWPGGFLTAQIFLPGAVNPTVMRSVWKLRLYSVWVPGDPGRGLAVSFDAFRSGRMLPDAYNAPLELTAVTPPPPPPRAPTRAAVSETEPRVAA
jgi:hypothetical protein